MLNDNDYIIIEYIFKFLKNNKEFDNLTLFSEIERLINKYNCSYKPYFYYRYALNKDTRKCLLTKFIIIIIIKDNIKREIKINIKIISPTFFFS